MGALSALCAQRPMGRPGPRAPPAILRQAQTQRANSLPPAQLNVPARLKGLPMPRRCLLCAAAVLLTFMISQRSNSQQPDPLFDDTRAATAKKFAALSDQFMKDSLSWSPVSASAAGYHSHMDPKFDMPLALDEHLDDFSPQSLTTKR